MKNKFKWFLLATSFSSVALGASVFILGNSNVLLEEDKNDSTIPSNPDVPENLEIEPILNSNLDIVNSFSDLYSSTNTNIDQNIKDIILEKQLQQKIISNYDKFDDNQKSSLQIDLKTNLPSNKWGNISYNDWKKETVHVYYGIKFDKLNVSSLNDLHDMLTPEFIKNIFVSLNLSTTTDKKTYNLVQDSNIGLENGLLHINILETQNQRNEAKYDLQIPISDFNLKINSEITISGKNIKTTSQKIDINYNITVDKNILNKQALKTIDLNEKYESVTVNNLLENLNWASQPISSKSNNSLLINNDVISKEIGLYNVEFSNFNLSLKNPENDINSPNYDGIYNLTFDATPHDNHVWDDGTKSQLKITIENIQINLSLAEFKDQDWLWQNDNELWKKITTYSENIQLNFADTGINDTTKENISNFLLENNYLEKIETYENDLIKNDNRFKHVEIKIALIDNRFYANKQDGWENWNVLIEFVPKKGYVFNYSPHNAKKQTYVNLSGLKFSEST